MGKYRKDRAPWFPWEKKPQKDLLGEPPALHEWDKICEKRRCFEHIHKIIE